jgi:hypothetical protein
VWGYGSAVGVYGTPAASGAVGVEGNSSAGYGVYGISGTSDGVHGYSNSSFSGVAGWNDGSGAGIWGYSASGYAGYFNGSAHVTGALTCGSGCTSDERLKNNIAPLKGSLDRLLQLKGVSFEWKDPTEHKFEVGHGAGTQIGFIAQQVESVFPNWVDDDGYKAKDGVTYRTMDLRQIEALEVESIRELKAENDELRSEREGDRARLARLEERLEDALKGRDPITGGVAVGRGTLLLAGLGLVGALGWARRRRSGTA